MINDGANQVVSHSVEMYGDLRASEYMCEVAPRFP